jgi:LuxR family maltose regulon positive regulatory protein
LERWEQLDAHRDAPDMRRFSDAARVWPFFGRVQDALRRGWKVYNDPDAPPATHDAIASQVALVLWFAGDAVGARALVERHLDAIAFPHNRSWAHATLALCAAQDGDDLRAVRHGAQATAIAQARGGMTALPFAIAYQAHADALRLAGRHDDAADVLDHVEHVTGRHPGSLHHALSLILRAELHLTRRDRNEARRTAVQARGILARYPDVGVLDARLAGLEELLHGRADDGLAGSEPTKAERRVLELLGGGLTLEGIAKELYVSIHTVKSHRRRIYRRLGVDNRADALAVARRRGLL